MLTFKEFISEAKKKEEFPVHKDTYPLLRTNKIGEKREEHPIHTETGFPMLGTTKIGHNRKLEEASNKPFEGIGEKDIHKERPENHDDTDFHAIRKYTGSDHFEINNHLWKNRGKAGSNKDIKRLDTALSKHRVKNDLVVYSGLKVDPSTGFKKDSKTNSTVFHHPSFLSTSTSKTVAKGFVEKDSRGGHGNYHILRLHVPKGAIGQSIKDVSAHKRENEFLLHRGHHIEIHHEPTREGKNTVWHGRIVGHSIHD